MKDKPKFIAEVIIVIAVLIAAYGGYKFERWVNWKLVYESNVESKLEELNKRINELQLRIERLENVKQ